MAAVSSWPAEMCNRTPRLITRRGGGVAAASGFMLQADATAQYSHRAVNRFLCCYVGLHGTLRHAVVITVVKAWTVIDRLRWPAKFFRLCH